MTKTEYCGAKFYPKGEKVIYDAFGNYDRTVPIVGMTKAYSQYLKDKARKKALDEIMCMKASIQRQIEKYGEADPIDVAYLARKVQIYYKK